MNETIDITIWQRPENEEKIKTYTEAGRNKSTVKVENFICLVDSYECDNRYFGHTEWRFCLVVIDYVKSKTHKN